MGQPDAAERLPARRLPAQRPPGRGARRDARADGRRWTRCSSWRSPRTRSSSRLAGRRTCRNHCGHVFHVDYNPPEDRGRLRRCGGELYQRDDDSEETVRQRLEVYADADRADHRLLRRPAACWCDRRARARSTTSPSARWTRSARDSTTLSRTQGRPPCSGRGRPHDADQDRRADREDARGGAGRRRDPARRSAAAVAPGATTKDLDALAEKVIRRPRRRPIFLGYRGFPATICTSVNDEVVHGIPAARSCTTATSSPSTAARSSTAGTATPPSPSSVGEGHAPSCSSCSRVCRGVDVGRHRRGRRRQPAHRHLPRHRDLRSRRRRRATGSSRTTAATASAPRCTWTRTC